MAPIKRKGATAEPSAKQQKRARVTSEESKAESGLQKKSKLGKEVQEADRKSAVRQQDSDFSIVRDEEPSFPRGGGSVLTPLERKQIQQQATRDVLFEHKGPSKTTRGLVEDDSDVDIDMQDASADVKPAKKPRKSQHKKQANQPKPNKEGVRIESLSFKRLTVGTMVLGQVTSINANDIGLALPNNLTGYVPLTAMSKTLDQKIEKLLNVNEGEEDDSDEEEDALDLKSYFYLGQYLRASVTLTGNSSTEAGATKIKKRIELSLDPRQTNFGLSKSDLAEDVLVQASVASIEDHGLVMDIGLEGQDIRGFMSSNDIDSELDFSTVKEGSVFLCVVTGFNTSKTVVKLSSNLRASASVKKSHFLTSAPTINTFLPGTAAEILVTDVSDTGLAGKIMGLLDSTVDIVHSGANSGSVDLTKRFQTGTKIKGRIICTFPASEPYKVGFSLLDHVLKFTSARSSSSSNNSVPSISAVLDANVVKVEPGLGLYVEVGSPKHLGFVHVSRVADGTVETISAEHGAFRLGSTHEARVTGYNPIDNLFLLSFERAIIDQPFIRLEDVTIGAVVKAKIEKVLIGPNGVDGIILSLADGITGMVPSIHLADTILQHPEKKFREGLTVSARILSVDLEKQHIRLTLKKSLLNSDSAVWMDYNNIVPGTQSPGTIINIQPHGAIVQFYSSVKGFLPVSEMSEAYIKDPSQHFRKGQVVNVHCLNVDAASERLLVSCKDPSTLSESYKAAFDEIHPGVAVVGTVFQKSSDDLLLKLDKFDVIAQLTASHLSDGDISKQNTALSKIRVGQKLPGLVVLNVERARRLIKVTNKPSLKRSLKEGSLPSKFQDIHEGMSVTGFVRAITSVGVFVEFLGGLNALLPKRLIDDEHINQPHFGLHLFQPLSATIHQIDEDFRRFTLTMRPSIKTSNFAKTKKTNESSLPELELLSNPVDENIKSVADFIVGKATKARIASVKDTQINVVLADNIQGRIDVSEVFDKWEDIKDRKRPLCTFRAKEVIDVRILGVHDARTHKFLPISHRTSKNPVFELSAKPSVLAAQNLNPLQLEQMKVGSAMFGFINNFTEECAWVNLSPNVRGRLRAIDLTDDLASLADLENQFPIGSALKVRVIEVDATKGRLDLSGKQKSARELTIDTLSKGMILPGRVTKITEKQLTIQLSETLVGLVGLTDMADDYSKIDTSVYRKNEVLRVCIINIDKEKKNIYLSLRPSKILSSSLPVQDPEINSISQLKVNDVVRGFIRRVADNGLFVSLGHNVVAYVRISDLSDSYLKEWKDEFQTGQLVKGRVSVVDEENNKLQLTLKESALDPNYKTLLTFRDFKPGQVVTGKVRKVEEFGAFIVIDGSANVSGLCHRSQMAEQVVEDARKLFEADDNVKAKILKIDTKQQKISFGLKASYFEGDEDSDSSDEGGALLDSDDDSDEESSLGGVELDDGGSDVVMGKSGLDDHLGGLDVGGFDWTGNANLPKTSKTINHADKSDDEDDAKKKKKRSRKPEIQVDQTGDLDARGPQSVADYERLLLGEPDSSILWLQYMAFQLELGEVEKAREVGERALRSISIGQDTEKMNIWVALLNLENIYGTDDSLEEVFKRACQYNDTQEVYERLISIFIQSGKNEKADELFQTALKKKISSSPKFFINYATFLFDNLSAPDRGRELLPRAMQSLPTYTHVEVTSKFIQLEFRSANGDVERGRTLFEGLLSSFPKRIDLWNILLDLEMKQGDAEQVRQVFQRVLGSASDDSGKKLKAKQARFFFKKWLSFEETLAATERGSEKRVEEVKAKAAEYVNSLQAKR
ncbi:putative rRNA biogenesis protein RRP5 [Talaromyces proteolyticus]|uniref:rRNA biogenesis protein RRP5 n=1 Tax=Talaromyces proteolyticus TaxID=1131652 RepID=A0AAD4KQ71_9EURO|nr:putative rRNA biogenesis protein RRP5 [Talaromyces proteolyticus]KAH8696661.1 putative rRNA biogenesis protein RRP5 [Talaromyces proteolyticus]